MKLALLAARLPPANDGVGARAHERGERHGENDGRQEHRPLEDLVGRPVGAELGVPGEPADEEGVDLEIQKGEKTRDPDGERLADGILGDGSIRRDAPREPMGAVGKHRTVERTPQRGQCQSR